jgi:hypothetical protein
LIRIYAAGKKVSFDRIILKNVKKSFVNDNKNLRHNFVKKLLLKLTTQMISQTAVSD